MTAHAALRHDPGRAHGERAARREGGRVHADAEQRAGHPLGGVEQVIERAGQVRASDGRQGRGAGWPAVSCRDSRTLRLISSLRKEAVVPSVRSTAVAMSSGVRARGTPRP